MSMQDKTYNIHVHHITRVEGHGSIVINTKEGKVEDVRLEIVEAPRFFENFIRGLKMHEVPMVIGRICGICCVGHQLASTLACEDALKMRPSQQTIDLRKLLCYSQFLQSHVLHVYFLAVPDYVGSQSVLPLAGSHPEVVKRALKLKKLSNDFTTVMGGRTLHPMANTILGWRKLPSVKAMQEILDRLIAAIPDLKETVNIVKTLPIPPYERETEYISIKHPDEYALYEGDIYSSETKQCYSPSLYRTITNEFLVPHSTTKWSKHKRESYMVGALARVNNNYDQLRSEAKEVAKELGFKVPCFNPYMNNVAQVIEIVHCAYESVEILQRLIREGLKEEKVPYAVGKCSGVGAHEVPRGLLFHEVQFDENGICCGGNGIIPTSQNINNIERDMEKFVPEMLPVMSQDELTLRMEMLVRAYDPCISCSVHMLNVKFK